MLQYARDRGLSVMGETCPQHLFFTVDHLKRPDGAKWICSPPMRMDYNLYEGWKLTGYPEKVFLRGNLIVDGDQWLGKAGMGKFLHRQPTAEVL
jgi:dihydroorotase-like cyclic amidohydrolase